MPSSIRTFATLSRTISSSSTSRISTPPLLRASSNACCIAVALRERYGVKENWCYLSAVAAAIAASLSWVAGVVAVLWGRTDNVAGLVPGLWGKNDTVAGLVLGLWGRTVATVLSSIVGLWSVEDSSSVVELCSVVEVSSHWAAGTHSCSSSLSNTCISGSVGG